MEISKWRLEFSEEESSLEGAVGFQVCDKGSEEEIREWK